MNKEAHTIFHELANKYGQSIEDTKVAESFFDEFMKQTRGCVNVDFINGDNWDKIENVDFDHEKGLMYLYYRLPEKDPEIAEMRKMAFPMDVYGMAIKLDAIRFVRKDTSSPVIGIAIRGVTDNNKLIKKSVKGNLDSKNYISHKFDFFATEHLKKDEDKIYSIIGIDTPIIACWIIPKTLHINAITSEKILYHINLDYLYKRIIRIRTKFYPEYSTASCKEYKTEVLQAAGNALRNVGETLLKLMICYYCNNIKEAYHTLLWDDLINRLNTQKIFSDDEKSLLTTFIRKVNELSHASGIPAEEYDIIECAGIILKFVNTFKASVEAEKKCNNNAMPSSLPSPTEFIDENLHNWCFKTNIEHTVSVTEGKCSFKVERIPHIINLDFFVRERGIYLCSDGYFKSVVHNANEILNVFDRQEFKNLIGTIECSIKEKCKEQGFDTSNIAFECSFSTKLEKNSNPTHLFTLEEIKELMRCADDSVNNQLVIDEDGYPHLVHNAGEGNLYPVSIETWCAGNYYVGSNSSLSDAEPSYHLCLIGWVHYLETGTHFYDDNYQPIEDEEAFINRIRTFM